MGGIYLDTDTQKRISTHKRFSADCGEKQGQEDFALTSICTTVSDSKNSWKSSLSLKEQGKCIHFSFNVMVQEKRCNAIVFQHQILNAWVLESFRNLTETKLAPSLEKQGEDIRLRTTLSPSSPWAKFNLLPFNTKQKLHLLILRALGLPRKPPSNAALTFYNIQWVLPRSHSSPLQEVITAVFKLLGYLLAASSQ